MYELVAFYLFSILTIVMFTIVVISKNALYSMSALAAGMILISGFFFLLEADFLGVVQIIVYTGAVMALYGFGMMFFDTTSDVKEDIGSSKIIYGLWIVSAVLVVLMISAPFVSDKILLDAPLSNHLLHGANNPQAVGIILFTKYLVQFELAAVMLLVAMISGIVLVSKKMDEGIKQSDEEDEQIIKEEFNLNAKGSK